MSADFRQTTADFELETRIRQVSQDVLKILLKKYPQNKFSHDNVFDFVKENRALLQSFDERIRNSQTQCSLIDGKIDKRLDRIDVLAKDIREIKEFSYAGLKNVNREVAEFQRQMDQVHSSLRVQRPLVEKTSIDVSRLDNGLTDLKQAITNLQERTTQRMQKESEANTARVDQVRIEFERMLQELVQSKEALIDKQERFAELTRDIELFKSCRVQIDAKIDQLFEEVECRALQADLLAHKKQYDDKVMGYFENVNRSISRLDSDVKKRIKTNEEKTQLIFKDQEELANRLREDFEQGVKVRKQEQEQLVAWIKSRFEEGDQQLKQALDKLDISLSEKQASIDALQEQINNNRSESRKQATSLLEQQNKLDKDIQSHVGLISGVARTCDEIKLEIIRTNDRIESVSKQSGSGTDKFQEVEQELEKLRQLIKQQSSRTDSIDVSVGRITAGLSQFNERLNKVNSVTLVMRAEIAGATEKQEQKMQELRHFTEESLANYTQKFAEIKDELKALDRIKQQISAFAITFSQQIAANELFRSSVTERLEGTIAQLTKFRSDITIRLDGSNKEIVKARAQLQDLDKMLQLVIGEFSVFVQVATAITACLVSLEFEGSSDKTKQESVQKFSSLYDGFILELDAKSTQESFKYRGEIVKRLGLLSNILAYVLKQCDSIRKNDTLGKTFESGKTVFQSVQPSKKYSSEETRRNSLSMRTVNKRGDSFVEFPKLGKKD